MSVFWLIPAQDQLQNAIAQSVQTLDNKADLPAELSATLEATFPAATAIIVIQRINGFSAGLKNHVLRVEAIDADGHSDAAIVKIADGEKLASELAGWNSCARPSNHRGVVLMPLRAGAVDADKTPRSIVFEDAAERLRATQLVSLEEAALTSCRWNDPECESIQRVLQDVFLELQKQIYEQASSDNDAERLSEELLNRLTPGIQAWKMPKSPQDDYRKSVLNVLPGCVVDMLDPVDYLESLLTHKKHLPEVMRGCAHGDLHGRNILVGVGEERASFAAVFDYEDMGRECLVGWDFAKLETELKVRAFSHIFHGEEPVFIGQVADFERKLAEETLRRSKNQNWRPTNKIETPQDRLLELLMTIRRCAMQCLAFQPQRTNSWLHELNFLLAAYGTYAGKFRDTYGRREFLGAYISAATASVQHAWAKNAGSDRTLRAVATAKLAIQEERPGERPDIEAEESFHVPFAFAKTFCRSRKEEFVSASIEILMMLRDKFSYALEIWQEIAFAHLELLDLTRDSKHLQDAKSVLSRIEIHFPYRSHLETLCRHGRLYKDCGDFAFDKGNHSLATKDYLAAYESYLQAYAQDKNYYPGINAATLNLLLGKSKSSEELAEAILQSLSRLQAIPEGDLTWVLATKAEAHLLLGNCGEAVSFYEQAIERPDCTPHHRNTMFKQVQRILRVKPCTDSSFDPSSFERVFE